MPAILTERIIEQATQIAVGLHRSFAGVLQLPIVRVQGGVYFMNRTYGTSLYADQVLVIKRPVEGHHDKTFEMGDVEMTDVEDEE